MNLSTEAKVGSVSVIAFLLLAYMIIHLGSFSFGDRGYEVQAVFTQVNGLKKGDLLRYSGVNIGHIKDIQVSPEGVNVTFSVNPGAEIPVGSIFRIGSDGLVGEKYINITPPSQSNGFLAPNDRVRGQDVQGFDELMASSDKVLAEVHELMKSLNEILGDDKVKAAMKESMLNAKELTHNLSLMSAAMARMAENNEGNVNGMMSNLNAMSATLRAVTERVDAMLSGMDNDGQTVNDLRETVANIKNTSNHIEKMAAALDGVVTDPETAKNLKETLKNAHSLSEKASQMMSKVDSLSTKAGFEVMYNNKTGQYRSNADLRINTSPQDFAILGVTDIGDGSKGNFQIGKGSEQLDGRAGIMESKLGLGADAKLGKQLKLSVDVYDPNDVRVKLRTQYQLAPDTFIVGETDNINKSAEKSTYFGLRQTF